MSFKILELQNKSPEVVLKEAVVQAFDSKTNNITLKIEESFLPRKVVNEDEEDESEEEMQIEDTITVKMEELSEIHLINRGK